MRTFLKSPKVRTIGALTGFVMATAAVVTFVPKGGENVTSSVGKTQMVDTTAAGATLTAEETSDTVSSEPEIPVSALLKATSESDATKIVTGN